MTKKKAPANVHNPVSSLDDSTDEFKKQINRDFDKAFNDEPPVHKSLLELGCVIDVSTDVQLSLAISAKRTADALERIADALAKQTNTAADIFNMVEKL